MLKTFDPELQTEIISKQIKERDQRLEEAKADKMACAVCGKVRDKLMAASAEVRQLPELMKNMKENVKKSGLDKEESQALLDMISDYENQAVELMKSLSGGLKLANKIVDNLDDYQMGASDLGM